MWLFLGTLLWSVRLFSQSSTSPANSKQRSQIKKYVVVCVRSNLPQKSSSAFWTKVWTPRPSIKNSWIRPWDRLQTILNAAAHVVCLVPTFNHITRVLCNLHWLPGPYSADADLFGLAPDYPKKLLSFKESVSYDLRSNDSYELKAPKIRCKTFRHKIFARVGPSLWNNLPAAIRSTRNVQSFNQALNTLYNYVWHFPNEIILAQFIISLSSDCGVLFSFTLGEVFVNVFVFVSFFYRFKIGI